MDFDFLYKDYSQEEGGDGLPPNQGARIGEIIYMETSDLEQTRSQVSVKMVDFYKRNRNTRSYRRIEQYQRKLCCPRCNRGIQDLINVPDDTEGEARVWCRWCKTDVRIPLASVK